MSAPERFALPRLVPGPAFWMLSGALAFATMGALTHELGGHCDWLTIALVRAVFMFVTAALAARAAGARLVVWHPRTLWVRSLSGSFSLVCSFYALTRLPVGDVLTLTNTYPLWILVLSWLAARRAPALGDVLGVACGLAGVVLIERPHLAGDDGAAVVALVSSVSTAVAMMGLHRLRQVDPRAVVAHFAGVASLVAGSWFLLRCVAEGGGTGFGTASPRTLLMLAGVGLSGTAGQIFLTRAYAAGPPARVAVLSLTQVVFGLAFDVILWQRALTVFSLAGTFLVLVPTACLAARTAARAGAGVPPAPGKVPDPALPVAEGADAALPGLTA